MPGKYNMRYYQNRMVTVRGTDYQYRGVVVAVFDKLSGVKRYVVEDNCGRLFIHRPEQIELPSTKATEN